MAHKPNIDISHRKYKMTKNRHFPQSEWIDYIEKAYPKWYKEEYSHVWPVIIVYYPELNDSYAAIDSVQLYTFYINRFDTMADILKIFRRFLLNQKHAIEKCFGEDIASIILQYLPAQYNPLPPSDSKFYIHRDKFYIHHANNLGPQYSSSTKRYFINKKKSLTKLVCDMRDQNRGHDINLRLRSCPIKIKHEL